MPITSPPTMAPGRLPKPPTTAAGKALSPISPMLACTKVMGANSSPATAATAAASPQARPLRRCTGMPM
ncbi:hypothetical protein D3C72_2344300 [compost metagenome]